MAEEKIIQSFETRGEEKLISAYRNAARAADGTETAMERLRKMAATSLNNIDPAADKARAALAKLGATGDRAGGEVSASVGAAAKAMAKLDAATDGSTRQMSALGKAAASLNFDSIRNGGLAMGAAGAAGLVLSENLAQSFIEADRLGGKMSSLMKGKGLESGIEDVKQLANALAGLTGGDDDEIAAGIAGAVASGRLQSLREYGVVISANGQAAIEAAGKVSAQAKQQEILNQVLIAGKTAVDNLKAGTSEAAVALGEMNVRMGNLQEGIGAGSAKAKAALLGGILNPVMSILEASPKLQETAGTVLYVGSTAATAAGSMLALAGQAGSAFIGLQALQAARASAAIAAAADTTATTAETAAIATQGAVAQATAGKLAMMAQARAALNGMGALGKLGVGAAAVAATAYGINKTYEGLRDSNLSSEALREKHGAYGAWWDTAGGALGNFWSRPEQYKGNAAEQASAKLHAAMRADNKPSSPAARAVDRAAQVLSGAAAAPSFNLPSPVNTMAGFETPSAKAARQVLRAPAMDVKSAPGLFGALFGTLQDPERVAAMEERGAQARRAMRATQMMSAPSIFSDGSNNIRGGGATSRQTLRATGHATALPTGGYRVTFDDIILPPPVGYEGVRQLSRDFDGLLG